MLASPDIVAPHSTARHAATVAVPCEVCRGTRWRPAFRLPTLTVWRCRQCGLLRTWDGPQELPAAVTQHFSAFDLEAYQAYYQAFRQQTFRRLLTELQAFRPGGRFVDVGCGYGWLLTLAHAAGYVVTGIEPAPAIAEAARRLTGLPVITGDVKTLAERGESYDIITLCNVLEHVPRPRPYLAQVAALLAPSGILVIIVPNVQGLLHRCVIGGYRLTGGRWTSALEVLYQTENACRHQYHFSAQTLARLLTELDLPLRRCRTQEIIDVDRLKWRTRLNPSSARFHWASVPPATWVLKAIVRLGVACGLGDELVMIAQRHE